MISQCSARLRCGMYCVGFGDGFTSDKINVMVSHPSFLVSAPLNVSTLVRSSRFSHRPQDI